MEAWSRPIEMRQGSCSIHEANSFLVFTEKLRRSKRGRVRKMISQLNAEFVGKKNIPLKTSLHLG